MRPLLRILLNAATALSLALFGLTLVAVLTDLRDPGNYPLPAGPRTTYFVSCEPHRLRLVRQSVSSPSDPAFAASTSELDVVHVSRASGGEAVSGIGMRNVGRASIRGFQWVNLSLGWRCPPGTSGSTGAVTAASVFRLDYRSASVPSRSRSCPRRRSRRRPSGGSGHVVAPRGVPPPASAPPAGTTSARRRGGAPSVGRFLIKTSDTRERVAPVAERTASSAQRRSARPVTARPVPPRVARRSRRPGRPRPRA